MAELELSELPPPRSASSSVRVPMGSPPSDPGPPLKLGQETGSYSEKTAGVTDGLRPWVSPLTSQDSVSSSSQSVLPLRFGEANK